MKIKHRGYRYERDGKLLDTIYKTVDEDTIQHRTQNTSYFPRCCITFQMTTYFHVKSLTMSNLSHENASKCLTRRHFHVSAHL